MGRAALVALGLMVLGTFAWSYLQDPARAATSGPYAVVTMALSMPSAQGEPRSRLWLPSTEAGAVRTRFPVLLYFAGWPGKAVDNVRLIRELASHGYVVAGMEYPAADPREPFLDLASAQAFDASVRRNHLLVQSRALDALAVLDRLVVLDAADTGPLAHRLDIAHAGIFGHSFGGAVAAEACRSSPRFAAAANLDGLHFGEAARSGVGRPYLFMSDASPPPGAADLEAQDAGTRSLSRLVEDDDEHTRANLARNGGIYAALAGSRHGNFSDQGLGFRLRRPAGAIDPLRAQRVLAAYLLAFFGEHLQNQSSPLLLGDSVEYPEIGLQAWNPSK